MSVDISGYIKKRNRLLRILEVSQNLIEDATTFLQGKIVDEIINGPVGSDYPKSGYASAIGVGQSGFIGVNSGQLRNSIQQEIGRFQSKILVDFSAAPVQAYAESAAQFTVDRYGLNYMQIGLQIYGEFIKKTMRQEFFKFIQAIDKGRTYTYKNPFP